MLNISFNLSEYYVLMLFRSFLNTSLAWFSGLVMKSRALTERSSHLFTLTIISMFLCSVVIQLTCFRYRVGHIYFQVQQIFFKD